MTNPEPQAKPRKIEPWGIGIAAFLVLFVLSLLGFVVFASLQSRDLVESGYYERGLEYDERIDELERAQASEAVILALNGAARQLAIQFPVDSTGMNIPTGQLVMYRPSNASWDQRFTLALDRDGQQIFELGELPKGAWKAKVSWVIDGQSYYHEEALYLP